MRSYLFVSTVVDARVPPRPFENCCMAVCSWAVEVISQRTHWMGFTQARPAA